MSKGNQNYVAACAKKAKDIKNTAKRNKEFKSKVEPKTDQDE